MHQLPLVQLPSLKHAVLQLVPLAQTKLPGHAPMLLPPVQSPIPSHCVKVVSVEPVQVLAEQVVVFDG
jgi:hypothetical protein